MTIILSNITRKKCKPTLKLVPSTMQTLTTTEDERLKITIQANTHLKMARRSTRMMASMNHSCTRSNTKATFTQADPDLFAILSYINNKKY